MVGDYKSPCIGCKLRRTRCDRKQPICTSCKNINIPPELCHYKSMRIGLKDKNSKETLSLYRKRNEKLRNKLHLLKSSTSSSPESSFHNHGSVMRSGSSSTTINTTALSTPPRKRTKKSKTLPGNHDPTKNQLYITRNIGLYEPPTSSIHQGSFSWSSPLTSKPEFQNVMGDIRLKIKDKATQEDATRQTMRSLLTTDSLINSLKERINKVRLGLEKLDSYDMLKEVLAAIETTLPSYQYIMDGFERFFRFPTYYGPFLDINAGLFWSKFHRVFYKSDEGHAVIDIRFPQDLNNVAFIVECLALLIFVMFENMHRVNIPHSGHNSLIIIEYSKLLSLVLMMYASAKNMPHSATFGIEEALDNEHLIALCLINLYDIFAVQDTISEISEASGGILSIWKIISIAKLMKLNKNIDEVYSSSSYDYKHGLKSTWYYLVFLNICFSLEFGMGGKIKPEEIPFYPDLNNNISRSLKVMMQVTHDFSYDQLDPHEFTFEYAETHFIDRLKQLLRTELKPLADKMETLTTYNLDSPPECAGFRHLTVELTVHLLLFNGLFAIYSFCTSKAREIGDSKAFARYRMLMMKCSMLLVSIGPTVFRGYQRFLNHENADLYSPILTLAEVYIRLRRTYRRVGISISSEAFLGLTHLKSSHFEEVLSLNATDSDNIVNSILQSHPEYSQQFSISDLEDIVIEDNYEEMSRKFALLNDSKYILLTIRTKIAESAKYLTSHNYNMELYRTNSTFRFIYKIASTLLILMYRRDQATISGSSYVMNNNEQVIHQPHLPPGHQHQHQQHEPPIQGEVEYSPHQAIPQGPQFTLMDTKSESVRDYQGINHSITGKDINFGLSARMAPPPSTPIVPSSLDAMGIEGHGNISTYDHPNQNVALHSQEQLQQQDIDSLQGSEFTHQNNYNLQHVNLSHEHEQQQSQYLQSPQQTSSDVEEFNFNDLFKRAFEFSNLGYMEPFDTKQDDSLYYQPPFGSI